MYKYEHGGNAAHEDGRESIIDLSANINPLGMPEGVREAIICDICNCARYPDSESSKLREKIALHEGVPPEMIFCGNGASDIIFRLPRAMRAKKILVTAPTFSDYERSALSHGATVCRFELSPTNGFILGTGLLDILCAEKPDLVYICNPNNPTGVLMPNGLIDSLLDHSREIGSFVVVDECFLDFAMSSGEHTSKRFIDKHPNLVALKAFTKIFALPGLRLGYALCSDVNLISRLRFSGADWPVSNLAQAAATAALDNADDYLKRTVCYVSEQRSFMQKELRELGYAVYDSSANYVFLRNPYPFDLGAELDNAGIRIRRCGNFKGLDSSYYRIAVSTTENNKKLISAITRLKHEL